MEKDKIVAQDNTLEITGSNGTPSELEFGEFGELGKLNTLGEVTHQGDEDSEYYEDYGEEPTEEELRTLTRVSGKIPFRCWLIAIVELSERFAYYGLSAPFQNYMQNSKTDNPAGVLDLKSQGATGLAYFFQFWCYITPVFGGWLADTYWGKYNTICCGTGIYVAGILILFVTSLPSIDSVHTALGGFITAIILIGIGTGMIKANLSVLIADQFPKRKPRVITKKGKRVIEDPSITIQNVFMFFYLMINIGSLSVMATTELESHKGFWAAYLLPFCFFWVAVAVLALGKNNYVRPPVGERTISKSFRIVGVLIRNRFCYDAAKPSLNPEKNYPWSDKFVEEIRRALSACKVFAFYPIYWVCYGQMTSTFVTVGGTMELHGLPNDFLQAIDSMALIVFIPICEYLIYPFIRRFTPFRPITKIFWGFMWGSASMIYAAVLQHFIYSAGPWYNEPLAHDTPNHVHVAWQVPAYVFIAFSEIFASITGLEYAYSKAPASMKSFIMSIFLLTTAFGSALGCALSPVTEDPKYVWMYTGLAVACFIAGLVFWACFSHLNAKEEEMNAMDYEENNGKQLVGDNEGDLESEPVEQIHEADGIVSKDYQAMQTVDDELSPYMSPKSM
ncbi:PTR2 (YKR093W) [Zygosaccharomyces parabailii]|nr:PTR2 (YKR093W) [Zygosaccharomyces parabailii]CDH11174.1 probable Peptide transporter PTR2 [Zygosaccharomyces bailii ISA1307]